MLDFWPQGFETSRKFRNTSGARLLEVVVASFVFLFLGTGSATPFDDRRIPTASPSQDSTKTLHVTRIPAAPSNSSHVIRIQTIS